MNRRGWIVTSLVLALPGLAFWLAPGPPAASRSSVVAEAAWTLPALPAADTVQLAYQRLRARQPAVIPGKESTGINEESGDAVQPLAEGAWRLRGVVQAEGQRYALIETAAGQTRRYREGEVLPRGEKLRAVRRDRIEISDRDAMETRLLYRGEVGVAKP